MFFGGFLIYHIPRLRVFIDDRWELYGNDFMRNYMDAGPEIFREWERRYHFEIALVTPGSIYCAYLNAEKSWKIIAANDSAVLYKKVVLTDDGSIQERRFTAEISDEIRQAGL